MVAGRAYCGRVLVVDAHLGVVVQDGLQAVVLTVHVGGDEVFSGGGVFDGEFGDNAVGVEFDGLDDVTAVVTHVHGELLVRVQFPTLAQREVNLSGVFDVDVAGSGVGVHM